jgi:ribosomal protein L44E
MKIVFEPVKLRMSVGYKCTSCGKHRVKSVRVEHTVNPFNRNTDGLPKTRQEVYEDVKREFNDRVEKVMVGIICSKCEAA